MKEIFRVVFILVMTINFSFLVFAQTFPQNNFAQQVPDEVSKSTPISGQEFSTDLFTGSASFRYHVNVPSGVNILQPEIFLYYNHHVTNSRPGALGQGWKLNTPSITRDINFTRTNDADDSFILNLNGLSSELHNIGGEYHTERESYFRIEKLSGGNNDNGEYWIVTSKEGVEYRFGFNQESEIVSALENYTVKWTLDQITDTYDNRIYYFYDENEGTDLGVNYVNKITYNENHTEINFSYIITPPTPEYFASGDVVRLNHLLEKIEIIQGGNLVRGYNLSYENIQNKSFLKSIYEIGSDGLTSLEPTTFEYNDLINGSNNNFESESAFNLPNGVFFGDGVDYGVRIVDINSDSYMDIVKSMGNGGILEIWHGGGNQTNWEVAENITGVVSVGIVDSLFGDQGVRFADINGDGKVDIMQVRADSNPVRKVFLNNGTGFEETQFSIPDEINFSQLTGGGEENGCFPGECSAGFTPYNYTCETQNCTLTCVKDTCGTSGSVVFDDVSDTEPDWNDDDYEESDRGADYTPSANKCYKFEFTGSEDTDSGDSSECYDLRTEDYGYGWTRSCNDEDMDAWVGIGFEGHSSSWLSTLPWATSSSSTRGWVDDVPNNIWRYVYYTEIEDDTGPDTVGSDAGEWDGLNNVICDEAGTHRIYCAPTYVACDNWGTVGSDACGWGCAGESVEPYIVMGVYEDLSGVHGIEVPLGDFWDCSSTILDNDYFGDNNRYKVTQYSYTHQEEDLSCSRLLDTGLRLVDVNGDGRADIVRADEKSRKTWINNGTGFEEDSDWQPPLALFNDREDEGVRLDDLNGDGFLDIVKAKQGSTIQVMINVGKGWNSTGNINFPNQFFVDSSGLSTGLVFADVNSDGLPDLLKKGQGASQETWINEEGTWAQNEGWNGVGSLTELNRIHSQIQDLNSDGAPDIIVAEDDSTKDARLNAGVKLYLLNSVTNPLGGTTLIDYEKISNFDHTGNDDASDLAFSGWIVKNVTKDNSMNNTRGVVGTTHYSYEGGLFDGEDREFRGFNEVTLTNPDNSTTVNLFHQNDFLKGTIYFESTRSQNDLTLREIEYSYSTNTSNGVHEVFLVEQKVYNYDETLNPEVIETGFSYDSYGNILEIENLGNNETDGDESYEQFTYIYNLDDWIINKISSRTLLNSELEVVSKEEFGYDSYGIGINISSGDLTLERQWINSTAYIDSTYNYNSYGNLIESIDPRGFNQTFAYDSTNRFVISEFNELGHNTLYAYNTLFDEVENITDPNGFVTSKEYDLFGRIVKEIKPFDTSEYPTISYSYDFDQGLPHPINISYRENNGTSDEFMETFFLDGFGNVISIKQESDLSAITSDRYYDSSFRLSNLSIPYNSSFQYDPSDEIERTSYSMDSLNRVTKIIHSDGSLQVINYTPSVVVHTDRKGTQTEYEFDAFDRIIKITENNNNATYETFYSYEVSGNLVNITDNQGNEFIFQYDLLGRIILMDDPDIGKIYSLYDDNSNKIQELYDNGNNISYSYDGLNRLINKSSGSTELVKMYDINTFGTLTQETLNNISTFYSYDQRLRKSQETFSIGGENYTTSYSYDSMDRITSKILPNSETIEIEYNNGDKISSINGIMDSIEYNQYNLPIVKSYNNGLQSIYNFNVSNLQLKSISTDNLQNKSYEYDSNQNILKITDHYNDEITNFAYDNLDRLTSAVQNGSSSNIFDIRYEYDSIGNIIKTNEDDLITIYYYNSSIPHTPVRVIDSRILEITDFRVVEQDNREIVFRFVIENIYLSLVSDISWTLDTGEDNKTSQYNATLSAGEDYWVYVYHNYTSSGNYTVIAEATNGTASASRSIDIEVV